MNIEIDDFHLLAYTFGQDLIGTRAYAVLRGMYPEPRVIKGPITIVHVDKNCKKCIVVYINGVWGYVRDNCSLHWTSQYWSSINLEERRLDG